MVFGLRQVQIFRSINGNADKPLIGHTGDRGRYDFAAEAQRFPHAHPPEIGDANAAAVEGKLIVGESKAVVCAFLAKLRVACSAREEILESLTQLDDCHLRRVFRHSEHPWKLIALDRIQLAAQRRLRRLLQSVIGLPCLILALPLGQSPVVCKAGRSCSAQQIRGLRVVRVERNFVGNQHTFPAASSSSESILGISLLGYVIGKSLPEGFAIAMSLDFVVALADFLDHALS
ncbi:hypothetical protein THICB2_230150 [Thiomonas sp. CB2]|nr:hypothetical protein THICB2_230150 [Thiomonas sp. CB2]CQR43799.1 hypothetical protein THICB3360041 [Thiomonas sp. CB3]